MDEVSSIGKLMIFDDCSLSVNGPFSYSRCWTGTSLQWGLREGGGGGIIEKRLM